MKNLQKLSTYSQTELEEMLAEAERTKKLIEDNPDVEVMAYVSYQLDGDEIMTMESVIPTEFLVEELAQIVENLKEELEIP